MSERLPLFPLGAVLFPGMLLPLHVFEQRYRDLLQDLLSLPEPERRFGVVAIRQGREVGADGVTALYEVGCTAQLQTAQEHPDGTYDVVSVGATRFSLEGLLHDRPYLVGEVTLLADELGDAGEAAVLDGSVRIVLSEYALALSKAGAGQVELPGLPDDALVLSHVVAATVLLDLDERQSLLAQPDGVGRLRAELRLMKRETVLLKRLRAVPSPLLTRGPVSPN